MRKSMKRKREGFDYFSWRKQLGKKNWAELALFFGSNLLAYYLLASTYVCT